MFQSTFAVGAAERFFNERRKTKKRKDKFSIFINHLKESRIYYL